MGEFFKAVGAALAGLFKDGWGLVGAIAPALSLALSVAKMTGFQENWLQEVSWAWVFAPLTLWFGIAYARRWHAFRVLHRQANPRFEVGVATVTAKTERDTARLFVRNPSVRLHNMKVLLANVRGKPDEAPIDKLKNMASEDGRAGPFELNRDDTIYFRVARVQSAKGPTGTKFELGPFDGGATDEFVGNDLIAKIRITSAEARGKEIVLTMRSYASGEMAIIGNEVGEYGEETKVK